jgi:hypothetical protein
MTLEARTQGLLDLVETDRKRRCDAMLGEARTRAAATVAAAHAEARARVRNAFEEERRRLAARVAAARARLMTHQRAREQRHAGALLAAGWQKLIAALCERWRDPRCRQSWIASVIAEARKALPPGAWRIVHAPGWPDGEREALTNGLATTLGAPPQFVVTEAARAGLRVSADGNVLDGTLDGLIVDRAEIGARLLSAVEDQA